MNRPQFGDPAQPARDLFVVRAEALPAWLAGQTPVVRAWLTGSGFEAGLGEMRLLPGPDGAVFGAVAGLGTDKTRARMRFGVVKALAGLPGGAWRLVGDLTQAERDEAALGSLLAQYTLTAIASPRPLFRWFWSPRGSMQRGFWPWPRANF